jgi:hypothetical protein
MKKCKCDEKMKFTFCWDDAQQHAYNLYVCDRCGRICKSDVWDYSGSRWINLDGTVEFEHEVSRPTHSGEPTPKNLL